MPASVNAILGSKGLPKGGRPRHVSTVRTKGGPKRTLTYQGTPVSTKGIPPSKAPSRAIQVQKALERVQKAYGKTRAVSGLDPEQQSVLSTVLRQGEKAGATKREKLAAVETGLVESGMRNLSYGDADSRGWRQERTSQYGTGPKGANNVKASAKRFFQEIKTEGAGAPTPGLAAQGAQGSAFPERYDQQEAKARQLLKASQVKPKPKDEKTLAKAGVDARKPSSPSQHRKPFKPKGPGGNPAKLINPKWDPDSDNHSTTILAKGISPVVKKWSRKYDVEVGEAKAESGHVSPGHLQTGTATDLYPQEDTEAGWDKLERGLRVLEKQGFEVGYGSNGVGQAWANHGRGNHAHVEWVGQGSSTKAIQKLAGLTEAQIAKMEQGQSGGGSIANSGFGGSTTGGTSTGAGGSKTEKKLTPKEKLARIRSKYGETAMASTDSPSPSLRRKYGNPAV